MTVAATRSPSNLALRLATIAVGLPVVVGLVWLGGAAFAIAAGAVALLASAEFTHGWLLPSRPTREVARHVTGFAAPALVVAGSHWRPDYVVLGVLLMAVTAGLGWAPARPFGPRKPFRVQAGALAYIGLLLSTLVLTRDLDHGRDWVLVGLLSTFATDSGAYAAGRLFGRHPLAPRISPKKTVEGAIGGYVVGAAAVLGLSTGLSTGASFPTILPLALALPLASQAGDLFESWIKRRMGVKDASGLLPGHGGFLDRLDSLLFVFPLVYAYLQWRVV